MKPLELKLADAQYDPETEAYTWKNVHIPRKMGGVMLTYRTQPLPTAGCVRLVTDEEDTALHLLRTDPSYSRLYPLKQDRPEQSSVQIEPAWNTQLFPLKGISRGTKDVTLICKYDLRSVMLYPAAQMVTGVNPVIRADMPDPDIIRVDDVYYMASTTMHFNPVCTLLRSYDLINWEIIGYVADTLPETDARCLKNGNAYGKGMWAPSLRWHNGVFHICFSANDTHCTYHYWSQHIEGPWEMDVLEGFYHDCSLFFDDDGRAYMVYGHSQLFITELDDALHAPREGGLHRLLADYKEDYKNSRLLGYEGAHLYKRGRCYYLFTIHSSSEAWYREESVFRADDLRGPWIGGRQLHHDMGYYQQGVAQGGMVDTPDGRWFAFMFQDRGASGRIPVLMPMCWVDDMPLLPAEISEQICNLTTRPGYRYAPVWHSDRFTDASPSAAWQWNHIPHPADVSWGDGSLRITAGTLCSELTAAPNMLTHRLPEQACSVRVNVSGAALKVGDMAGLCVFQSCYAAVALARTETGYEVRFFERTAPDDPPATPLAAIPWPMDHITLAARVSFAWDSQKAELGFMRNHQEQIYLHDHPLHFTLDHFTGNRLGLFVMAGTETGGVAQFRAFRIKDYVTLV